MLSERETALLWGSTWWFASAEEARFDEPKHAATALAAQFPNAKPALRLIYQPTSLASASVPFPNALELKPGAPIADEFALLNDPACAWSWDGPFVREGGREVTLYYEQQSGELGQLTRSLESLGFEIESVWPLAPMLAALPASRRDSPWQLPPTAVLAIEGNKACGIRQISGRAHDHRSWHGPTALAEAGAWLETFARRREVHVALVIENPDGEPFDAHFPFLGRDDFKMDLLTISELLRERLVLPRHHPAQLVPPPISPE
ncbi:MAG: hypothetical protein Q8N18_07080 [Opitutaceae bacterium]|nr:hypothetical protein [Opitutaceae bacterium]